jgi:8-oxo-dGTP diphosphatase
MPRAQSIVYRDSRVLMVKHRDQDSEWWCLPGGGICEGELPADAALRELAEECNVAGTIVRVTSVVTYAPDDCHHTFLVDIGRQEPSLGYDPECAGREPILVDVRWLALEDLPERDRAFLWSAGLLGVGQFARVVESWGGEVSCPQPSGSFS